jgi:hypothetical protein
MTGQFVLRSTILAAAFLLFAPGAANAACTIDEASVSPTTDDVLPTMRPRQTFSFVAMGDCRNLLFSVQDTTLTKIPVAGGPGTAGGRTDRVSLNQSEWDSVVDESATTFTWSITAYSPGGHEIAQVTTTSEIDFDGDGWTRSDGDVGECDLSRTINPGVEEKCNAVDDNCNEDVDEDLCHNKGGRDPAVEVCVDGRWVFYLYATCSGLGY